MSKFTISVRLTIAFLCLFLLFQIKYMIKENRNRLNDSRELKQINNDFEVKLSMNKTEHVRAKKCESSIHSQIRASRKKKMRFGKMCRTHHQYMKGGEKVLIEVGGNHGYDAKSFQQLYQPRHIILEPIKTYADILKKEFKTNQRVTVLNFGLDAENKTSSVAVRGEATSLYAKQNGSTQVTVKNSTEFFMSLGVGAFQVDLLHMDCEGCEYGVMENIFAANMAKYFKNIQFEWHRIINSVYSGRRYCRITELLSRTHRPTFKLKFTFENWRRNDLP